MTGWPGGCSAQASGQRVGDGAHPALAVGRAGRPRGSRRGARESAGCAASARRARRRRPRRRRRAARPRPASRREARARLSARSKTAVAGREQSGSPAPRRATRRASSSLRRSGETAGGRSSGAERVVGELGDDADPRQEAGRPGGAELGERPGGAAGVDPDLDARHGLGRLARQARVEAGEERAGEVDAGGQREGAGAVLRRKDHQASAVSASAMPSGRPTSTQPPAMDGSAEEPSGGERVPDRVERKDARRGSRRRAAVSMIWAPA